MSSLSQRTFVALLLGTVLTGCLDAGEDRVLTIDATAFVEGTVFLDSNGNRAFDPSDAPLPGVTVHLLVHAAVDTVASTSTDLTGAFSLNAIPIGTYDVVIDTTTIGDDVDVVSVSPSPLISAQRGDSLNLTVVIGFPRLAISQMRNLPVGVRVFVEGTALNARTTFGDLSVHVTDGTAAVRVTRVRNEQVFVGDSVRFLGTSSTQDGQPTLSNADAFILGISLPPLPERVTSAIAATADNGSLDAALIQVPNVTIQDRSDPPGADVMLTVDDGSGPLRVALDEDIPFTNLSQLTVGTILDVTGVLVPRPNVAETWQLKPRSTADVIIN